MASTGGHLTELVQLRRRLVSHDDTCTWVTSDSDQARSLLADEDVIYLPPVGPRAYVALASSVVPATRVLARVAPHRVISTGAAVALAFLPLARRRGMDCHYIESAARTQGPSVTGRLLRRVPGVELYTQDRAWAGGPWRYAGSVFGGMEGVERGRGRPVSKILVTLGTSPFAFPRLVARLRQVLSPSVEVVWQLGATPAAAGLPGRVVTTMTHGQLVTEMAAADVVVSHAGVGSALTALSLGRCPVLVPRSHARGEHVDDHQQQIASALELRGLAVTAAAESLGPGHLQRAADTVTRVKDSVPPFELHGASPVRLGTDPRA